MEYINQLKERPEPKTSNLVEVKIIDEYEEMNTSDVIDNINDEQDESLNLFLQNLNNFKAIRDKRMKPDLQIELLEKPEQKEELFFYEDEEIDFSISLNEKYRIWSLKEQSDDLIHDYMGKIKDRKNEKYYLSKILNQIYYYSELRNNFSHFDDKNIPISIKHYENVNPMISQMNNPTNHYPWLIPVSEINKKVYFYDGEINANKIKFNVPNIEYTHYNMSNVDEEVPFDENYYRLLDEKFTPFVNQSTNNFNVVGKDVFSVVLYNDTYFLQPYVSSISNIRLKNNKEEIVRIFNDDVMEINGYITLPYIYSKYSSLYTPNSYILDKSNLSKDNFYVEKIVNENFNQMYNKNIFKNVLIHEKKKYNHESLFNYSVPSSKKVIDYCIKQVENANENLSLYNLINKTKDYNVHLHHFNVKDFEFVKNKIKNKKTLLRKLYDNYNKQIKMIKNINIKNSKVIERKNMFHNINLNSIKEYDVQNIKEYFLNNYNHNSNFDEYIKYINDNDDFNIISNILKFINIYNANIDYEKMCGVEESTLEENIKQMVENYEKNVEYIMKKINKCISRNEKYQKIKSYKKNEHYIKRTKLVENIVIEDECISPYVSTMENIFNIENKYKRSEEIIYFVNKYCRPSTMQERSSHISYKYYYMCKESNCKLIPCFYYTLSKVLLENPTAYEETLQQIIKSQGTIDNNITICKYTGHIILSHNYIYGYESMHDNDEDNSNDFENTDEPIDSTDEFNIVNDDVYEVNNSNNVYNISIDGEDANEIIDNTILYEKQKFEINQRVEVYDVDKGVYIPGIIMKYKEGTYDVKYKSSSEEFVEPQYIRAIKEENNTKYNAKNYCTLIINDYINILSVPLKKDISYIINESYRILNLKLMNDLYKWVNIENSENEKELNKLKIVLLSVSLSMLFVIMYVNNVTLNELGVFELNKEDFKRFKKIIFDENITSKILSTYVDDYDLLKEKLFSLKDQELLLRFNLIMDDNKIQNLLKKHSMKIQEEKKLKDKLTRSYTHILPPLNNSNYININQVEPLDLTSLKEKIHLHSHDKLMLLKNKQITYANALSMMIKNESSKENLLLRNYVENTCCTSEPIDNMTYMNNIINYLNDKNRNILNFVNISKSHQDIIEFLTNIKGSNTYRHVFDNDEIIKETEFADVHQETMDKINNIVTQNDISIDSNSFKEILQKIYDEKYKEQNEINKKDTNEENIFNTIADEYKLDDIHIYESLNDLLTNNSENNLKSTINLLNRDTSRLKDKIRKFFVFKNDDKHLYEFFFPEYENNKIHNLITHINKYCYTFNSEKVNYKNDKPDVPKHWNMRKFDKAKLIEIMDKINHPYEEDVDTNVINVLDECIMCFNAHKYVMEHIEMYNLDERVVHKYLNYIYLRMIHMMIEKTNELIESDDDVQSIIINIIKSYALHYIENKQIINSSIESTKKKILLSKMDEKDKMVLKHDIMNNEQLKINTVHRKLKLGVWSVGVGNINKKIIEQF